MQTIAESWVEEGFIRGMNLGREEGVNIGRAEGVNLGRAEGVNLGREEGVNRGRAEGAQALREVIVEDLELQFSNLPQSLKERLQNVGELGALKALRRKLRDAASVEDCERIVASETPQ